MVSFYSSDIVNYTMVSLRSQASNIVSRNVLIPGIPSPFVIVLKLWSLLLGPGAVPAGTTLSNRVFYLPTGCAGVVVSDKGAFGSIMAARGVRLVFVNTDYDAFGLVLKRISHKGLFGLTDAKKGAFDLVIT
ncbi:hypothetical protein Tco_1218887 [Tanacetum coccineum]